MSTADLAERAAATHVIVIGAGISGLVAARECAKVGMRVTVLEASERVGGTIGRAELAGLTIDTGADSFALRGGAVRTLIDELGLGDEVVPQDASRRGIAGIPGAGLAPVPEGSILGIPENPFHDEVRRIIGWRGAWRAYLDRLRPPLTIGHADSLGRLVASRMGPLVRDRLVAPLTVGGFAIDPDQVDTDAAVPGLNAAFTRAGSLSGAVAQVRAERAEKAGAEKRSDAAPHGIAGGLHRIVDALLAELALLGTEVRTGATVESIAREGAGWSVAVAASDVPSNDDAPETPAEPAAPTEPTALAADAVIVATPEATARYLFGEAVAELGEAAPTLPLDVVTLLVEGEIPADTPAEIFPVPGTHAAGALQRPTAKWVWLREAAAGRHVVRVTFGGPGQTPTTTELDESDAAALALREATAILGLPADALTLVAAHRERVTQTRPVSALGAPDARAKARAAIARAPGLAAVGAWLAGTGLAQVIPDATAEADRLRRALLWGSPPDSPQ